MAVAAAASSLPPYAASFPGREKECARLHELLAEPGLALPLYIHGPSGCGKSAVLRKALAHLKIPTAFVDCIVTPTPQALFQSALNQLAGHRPSTANGYTSWAPCDSVGGFAAGLLQIVAQRGRICMVFDNAERLAARNGGTLLRTLIELPNLLAAADACNPHGDDDGVAGMVLPIFVGEALWGDFQRRCEGDPRVIHVRFPGYSMEGLGNVLKRDVDAALPRGHAIRRKLEQRHTPGGTTTPAAGDGGGGGGGGGGAGAADDDGVPPQTEALHKEAFGEFVTLFVDNFSEVCRDTHELRYLCRQLFPLYLRPAADGEVPLHDTRELYAKAGPHLKRALRSVYSRDGLSHEDTAAALAEQVVAGTSKSASSSALGHSRSAQLMSTPIQLPTHAQFLLISGFLASRLPARADVALFSSAPRKPGRRGSGMPRNTRLSETPHTFTLERLMAIYTSITPPEPASMAAPGSVEAGIGGGGGGGGFGVGGGAGAASSSTAYVPAPTGKPPIRTETLVQIASLIDLRLFSKASKDATVDGMRLRCEAPKELVKSVADAVSFDLRQYEEE